MLFDPDLAIFGGPKICSHCFLVVLSFSYLLCGECLGHATWYENRAVSGHITGYGVNDVVIDGKNAEDLCRAQNMVYNVVSISGCELAGKY